jgi:hypothetical protein
MFGQSAADFNVTNFQPFIYHDINLLFTKIVPNKSYKYWECVFNLDAYSRIKSRRVILQRGDMKYHTITQKYTSQTGFMVGCPPMFCSYYIVAVTDDNKVELINTRDAFKAFIGEINNLDEVKLTIHNNDYAYNRDTLITGAYQERDNDYLLFLTFPDGDLPMDVKRSGVSIKAILTKKGNFNVIEQKVYLNRNTLGVH